MSDYDFLPVCEFAFPGALRDQLVAAVLEGSKTSTTSTAAEYEIEQEELPRVGLREMVVDSAGCPVAVIETTQVRQVRLSEVDLQHALDEGDGYTSLKQWRAGHMLYWHSAELREALGTPDFTVEENTILVLQRFKLIAALD